MSEQHDPSMSKLKAQLPQETAQTPEPDRVNERLIQLEDAARKTAEGEWSAEELGEFLDGIIRILNEREQQIREIEIPPEAVEDFREELEVGFSGIQLYTEGVQRMMLFVEDPNPAHLEEGLELARQGNDHINEAMRINRDNRRKLEEMYIDASTMM